MTVLPAPERTTDLPTRWRVEVVGDAGDLHDREDIYIVAGAYSNEGHADALIKVCHAINVDGRDIRERLARLVAEHMNELTDPQEALSGD